MRDKSRTRSRLSSYRAIVAGSVILGDRPDTHWWADVAESAYQTPGHAPYALNLRVLDEGLFGPDGLAGRGLAAAPAFGELGDWHQAPAALVHDAGAVRMGSGAAAVGDLADEGVVLDQLTRSSSWVSGSSGERSTSARVRTAARSRPMAAETWGPWPTTSPMTRATARPKGG